MHGIFPLMEVTGVRRNSTVITGNYRSKSSGLNRLPFVPLNIVSGFLTSVVLELFGTPASVRVAMMSWLLLCSIG